MLRKKLQLLSVLFSMLLIVPLVVSCTINLGYIANRTSNPKVLNTFFTSPVKSWSSGVTNTADDNKILINILGTLVANDKYNRRFGDIAEQFDKTQENVGRHNADYTKWTYKISSDAKWFDHKGNFVRNIKASDMVNAAKYILYPGNLSLVASLYTEFIKGAHEINRYFIDNKVSGSYWNNPIFENKLGIKANDNTNEVEFTLSRPAYFFDTILTYVAFSPMPEEALRLGYNYGKHYKNLLYSGAYLVKDYVSTSRLHLTKNHNYRFAKLTKIEDIKYTLMQSSDASRVRVLFESGDTDSFVVNPNDTYGWKRYVGQIPSEPIFPGARSVINPEPTAWGIWFNFANTNVFNPASDAEGIKKKDEAIKAGKALQYDKIRKYILTHLNRSNIVKYYSQGIDKDPVKSSLLRNNMVSPKFAYDAHGNDYMSYIHKEYQKGFGIDDLNKAKYELRDGNDALLNNSHILDGQSSEEVLNDIRAWLRENIGQDYVTFRMITSPNLGPINKFLANAVDSFSKNGVINIVLDTARDAHDFRNRVSTKYDYDINWSGWGPDYGDPYTFLYINTIEGNKRADIGYLRLLSGLRLQNGMAPAYKDANLNNEYWNILKTSASEQFYNEIRDYTNTIKRADSFGGYDELESRFQAFAEAEFKLIYKYGLYIPLYVQGGSWNVTVSYLIPRTMSSIPYGSSKDKFWGAEKSAYLLTREERHMIETKYQEDLELIKKDHSALREDY